MGRRGEETRRQILEVARRLFASKGYAATSVRDIAAELGIANPSLYHHFSSKQKILEELVSDSMQHAQRALLDAQRFSGSERVRLIVEALIDSLEVGGGITGVVSGASVPSGEDLVRTARPLISSALGDAVSGPDRELKITMAIGAVEAVVRELSATATTGAAFVAELERVKPSLVREVMVLLSSSSASDVDADVVDAEAAEPS